MVHLDSPNYNATIEQASPLMILSLESLCERLGVSVEALTYEGKECYRLTLCRCRNSQPHFERSVLAVEQWANNRNMPFSINSQG